MSTLEVNKITPVSGGTTVQVGESGDTINIPAGATIANAGTATGFGVSLANGADNRVVTASSASALNGEANLTFDGSTMALNKSGSNGGGLVTSITAEVGNTESTGDGTSIAFDGELSDSTWRFGRVGGINSGSNYGGGLVFHTNAGNGSGASTTTTEKMRIDNSGNVLVNRTSQNASGYNGKVSILDSQNDSTIIVENNKTSGLGASILKVISHQNTNNSSYNLIDGHNTGNNYRFLVRDSGNVQNTNNSYSGVSDERIKQDITDANSQWEDIKALKVRNFKLKFDTSKTQIGVVAQELEASGMNGLVEETPSEKEDVTLHSDFGTIDDNGNFTQGEKVKFVKYSVLYMKAIKALQEAMDRIETLEAKVQALESA